MSSLWPFFSAALSERLPRVVLGVRKATPHDEELKIIYCDEELKIIVFSPSFVLHLINVPLGRLLFLSLSPSPVFVSSLLFTIFTRGMEFFFKKNKKVVMFCWNFQCDTPSGGGNRSTHYPGNWIVSVRVRTEHPVQPLLYLSISKRYQLYIKTRLINEMFASVMGEYVFKNNDSWKRCLRVGFPEPVEGRRDRCAGWPPDWGQ
jgi:hypothetical protein